MRAQIMTGDNEAVRLGQDDGSAQQSSVEQMRFSWCSAEDEPFLDDDLHCSTLDCGWFVAETHCWIKVVWVSCEEEPMPVIEEES